MGEFYVDRQLTNVTKQRIMDNGVGIDLICVGQEPLYAVPLFMVKNLNILFIYENNHLYDIFVMLIFNLLKS